jgi:hypothetical protein
VAALPRWIGLAVATAAAAVAFDRIGLPSASLFAALLVGWPRRCLRRACRACRPAS